MALRHIKRWLSCVIGMTLAVMIMLCLYGEDHNNWFMQSVMRNNPEYLQPSIKAAHFEDPRNTTSEGTSRASSEAEGRFKTGLDLVSLGLSEKVLIVYYTRTFEEVPVIGREAFWPYFSAGEECPVECELSTDKTRASEATALVIHARNIAEAPPRDIFPGKIYILHSNEHPVSTEALSDPAVMSQFNYFISYRLDSDFPCPQMWKPSLSAPVSFAEKRGTVFWASSNCEPIRTQYVKELMAHIKVDSFGSCLHNAHGLTGPHEPMRIGEVSRFYKFQLVFFSQDCEYFVDEKLSLALDAGTVPVVMGTERIDEFLPGRLKHSVIRVRDFKTPKDLASFLHRVAENETAYNEYLQWKQLGLGLPPSYRQTPLGIWWDSPYALYCRVCMALTTGAGGHSGLRPITCDKRSVSDWISKI